MTDERPCILVVDDDPDVLMMLGIALRRVGYQPHLVATLDAALHVLATTPVAMILTDYGLRQHTARQVIEQAQHRTPAPIIVLMTGHSWEILADHLCTLPITAFLAKPFALDTLYQTLSRCLEMPQHTPHPMAEP